jgi:hypothetical protein
MGDTPENEEQQSSSASTDSQQKPWLFKAGQSGNPAGRKPGSKNKFTEDFWRAAANDFAEHGASVFERVRNEDPAKYLAAMVNILPKDVNVKHESTDAFVNLWKLISDGTAEQAIAKARGEHDSDGGISGGTTH